MNESSPLLAIAVKIGKELLNDSSPEYFEFLRSKLLQLPKKQKIPADKEMESGALPEVKGHSAFRKTRLKQLPSKKINSSGEESEVIQLYGLKEKHKEELQINKTYLTGNISIKRQKKIQHSRRNRRKNQSCLLYTSDAADDTPCVDLGGRRIIKKKKRKKKRAGKRNVNKKNNKLTHLKVTLRRITA
eukprot:TRINITY_DN26697_c0_g1_i1.p2 TRINITY_DN26697_c0_g1~~TRINITY_DN26697_c0_g1_i1.p2  ORF type:complete len:188 (+),score=44.87 TRINITY_DN26697_c0_g1_i1:450-1013(+)